MDRTTPNRLRVLRAENASRKRKPASQRDTAVKAKIAFDRYWRIENGYAEPTPEERESLARVFRVSADEVFRGVSA